MRTSRAPAKKMAKSKPPAVVKVAAISAPAHPQNNPPVKISETKSSEVKLAQAGSASPAAEAQLQGRQNWGWSPGERWKRRLRHLR